MTTETRDKRQETRKNEARVLVACCLLLVAAAGCIRRSLTIRTDPSEAMIYVNDTLKGKSPITYDFQWYGWHRVTIRKDGFVRLDDRKLIRSPLYLWIPLDLIMELLPFPIHDDHAWSYTLTPAPTLPTPTPPPITPQAAAPTEKPAKSKSSPAIPFLSPSEPKKSAPQMNERTTVEPIPQPMTNDNTAVAPSQPAGSPSGTSTPPSKEPGDETR